MSCSSPICCGHELCLDLLLARSSMFNRLERLSSEKRLREMIYGRGTLLFKVCLITRTHLTLYCLLQLLLTSSATTYSELQNSPQQTDILKVKKPTCYNQRTITNQSNSKSQITCRKLFEDYAFWCSIVYSFWSVSSFFSYISENSFSP